jgi:hypothetical protein
MKLLKVIILVTCNIQNSYAEIIFKDGFDKTHTEINCPNALALTEETNVQGGLLYSASEVINPAGNIDYYKFPIDSQEWIIVGTNANQTNFDAIVTVYNAEGTNLLTQTSPTDSSVIYRSLKSESICITVEDISTSLGTSPQGGPNFNYLVFVLPIDFNLYDSFNIENEPNDTTFTAQSGLTTYENIYTRIAGSFINESDVDNYQLSTPIGSLTMLVNINQTGEVGIGSTTEINTLDIYAGNGVDVLSRINPSLGVSEIYMPIQEGQNYYIQAGLPTIPLGNNPFYVVSYTILNSQNQLENNDTLNNSSDGAEIANPNVSSNSTSHYITGTLSGSNDVDWWSFEATIGKKINLYCSSWYSGSGVRDALFNIYDDPNQLAIQSETEVENSPIYWSNHIESSMPEIPVTVGGTHYLSIEASQFSNSVLGRNYICSIHVLPAI